MCRTLAAFSIVAALYLSAQTIPSGARVVTFPSAVDDTDQPYGLYVPKNLDSSRKYPLVIVLHDDDSNHRLALRRVFGFPNRPGETDADANRSFPNFRDVEYLVASPLARGTLGYQGIAEKDVYDVIADVKRHYPVDEDRIHLTGTGLGGGGTLWLGLTRPDIWASIAAVCPIPLPGTEDLVGNALNLPVKLYQGEIDPAVKAEQTRQWNQNLLQAGVKVEYTEYPGVRHNAGDFAYRGGSYFSQLDQLRRQPFPNRVRFAARDYEHSSAYWIRIDQMTPGVLATLDAQFESKNKLTVTTKLLDAFSITLKGHPMIVRNQLLNLVVDGTALRVRVQDSVSLTRQPKGWVVKQSLPLVTQKRPGQEGPVRKAISNRHVYVYGTGGSPSNDELLQRRNEAIYAAEWSTKRNRLMLTNRVISDAEVKPEDLNSTNFVLFGNRETNSVIARLSPKLPLSLNPGAADYGLVFVAPMGTSHYAVVSSGLPWWTRADQAGRPGLALNPVPYKALESFEDFILFKGGLDNVILEGYFDKDWKLPPAAAARLREIPAVTLP